MAIDRLQAVMDDEEKKKNQLNSSRVLETINQNNSYNNINDTTGDSIADSINAPIDKNAPSAGFVLGTAAKGLKDIVSSGVSGVGDAFNKVGSDISAGYNGNNPTKELSTPNTTAYGSNLQSMRTQGPNISTNSPTSNFLKDESTGKTFSISADGSINGEPKPLRDLGIMAGYKPDGTRIIPSGNQGDQDALRNNVLTGQDARALQKQQFDERNYPGGAPAKPWSEVMLPIGGKNAKLNLQQNLAKLAFKDPNIDIARDKNRIAESDVISGNKLRDIQGQILKNPPLKEKDFEPKILTDKDFLGNETQRIAIPNKENTGYVDGTQKQQAFETPSESSKALMIKNRNNPEYVSAYIKRFGKLPY